MGRKKIPKHPLEINTIHGKAKYVEIEDKFGNWDNNYYVKDGYYVIHNGKYHHIYRKRFIGDVNGLAKKNNKKSC